MCGTGERQNEALAKNQEDTKTGFLHDKEGPYLQLASESNLIYKITSVRVALAMIEETLLVIYLPTELQSNSLFVSLRDHRDVTGTIYWK